MIAFVLAQSASFAVLGGMFLQAGNTRLGIAQVLLGAVNVLVYL